MITKFISIKTYTPQAHNCIYIVNAHYMTHYIYYLGINQLFITFISQIGLYSYDLRVKRNWR